MHIATIFEPNQTKKKSNLQTRIWQNKYKTLGFFLKGWCGVYGKICKLAKRIQRVYRILGARTNSAWCYRSNRMRSLNCVVCSLSKNTRGKCTINVLFSPVNGIVEANTFFVERERVKDATTPESVTWLRTYSYAMACKCIGRSHTAKHSCVRTK